VDDVAWAKNRTQLKVRARVEHVFQVMKLKFGFVKARYRGLNRDAVVCRKSSTDSKVASALLGKQPRQRRLPSCIRLHKARRR